MTRINENTSIQAISGILAEQGFDALSKALTVQPCLVSVFQKITEKRKALWKKMQLQKLDSRQQKLSIHR